MTKGQDIIPNIAKKLRDDGYKFKWYCIGDGEFFQSIKNEIDMIGLSENLILLGNQNNPYPYLKAADIYCQPSRKDGFGITISEAKIFALPIVSTDSAGASEQLTDGETGFIVKFDINEIYYAMKTILDNKNIAEKFRINLMNDKKLCVSKIEDLIPVNRGGKIMERYILYSHAGSENHGCEALLRTSILTMADVESVYSGDVNADKKYGLEKEVRILPDKTEGFENLVSKLIYSVKYHIKKTDKLYFQNLYRNFIRNIEPNKVYISIGGDNYCYHFSEWLEVLNSEINKRGAKSVLWGCSINEDELDDTNVLQDLKRYSLITARESLTYELLKSRIPEVKLKYVPDTAFLLPKVEEKLPEGFDEGNTIGLNVSPVATKNAKRGEDIIRLYCRIG